MPGAGRSENKPVWRDKSAIRGQIRGRPLLFVPVEGDNTENMSESEEGLSFLCARLVASDDCDAKALRIVCGKLGALLERGKTEKSALSDDECACVEAAAVKLWNASVALRNAFTQHSETSEPEPSDTPTTVALLRGTALALLQLVVAAMPNTLTSAEVRTRILSIAVAAGRAFQDITDNRNAEGAFEIASQYAQDESDEFVIQKVVKESAMLLVYKAELMWTTSQSNVAFHLMNRVCSPRFLEMIGIREIDVIANTCIKLSKSVQHASDSVQWLKIALNLYSSIAPSPKTAKRKNELFLTLASEYLRLGTLETADAIVTKLLDEAEGLVALAAVKIKLAVLEKRDTKDPVLYARVGQLLRERVSMVNAKEEAIGLFLSILHHIAAFSLPDALALADWLQSANEHIPDKASLFQRIFLAKLHLLTHPSSGILSADALVCVRDVIRSVGERGSVSKDAARQAQMIVWKCGEAAMEGHRWQDAVDWIGVALKLAVGGVADEQNMAALLKKLALCHVQLRQFDEATEACRRAAICQQDAQSSLQLTYLLFLIHLEQGHAELASKQMENMAAQLQEAADPTKSLQFLLTTMDRSFKAGNQKVLKKILGILLKQFGSQDNHAWRCIIVMALRCLIRLVIAADTNQLDASVYGEVQKYIAAALTPLEALKRENAPSLNLEPELTWFSQTCWNLAVKTCAEFPAIACQFFSLSAKIASLSVAGEGGGLVSLPALKNQKISLFIAFLGEIELARDAGQSGTDHIQRARTLLTELSKCCKQVVEADGTLAAKDLIYHQSVALDYELVLLEYAYLKREDVVDAVKALLARAVSEDFPLETFQRMSDVALVMSPPSNVVFITVHAALGAMMKQQVDMNLKQFAEWFRLMVSSTQSSGPRIDLFQQAAEIIKSGGVKTTYPVDEIQWLLLTAWNNGCDFFSAEDKQNAVMWCEMAFKLAEFLPANCVEQVERVSYYGLKRADSSKTLRLSRCAAITMKYWLSSDWIQRMSLYLLLWLISCEVVEQL